MKFEVNILLFFKQVVIMDIKLRLEEGFFMERKEKFYKKQWFMWVFLILFPPIGIALVWLIHKELSVKKRIIFSVISALWLVYCLTRPDNSSSPESNNQTPTTEITKTVADTTTEIGSEEITTTEEKITDNNSDGESHIYDKAVIKSAMNGFRTEKIGEYSIITLPSDMITIEDLTDWYFNYVEKNDYKWCMILYSDKDDNSGIYCEKNLIQKNVHFFKDDYGDYALDGTSTDTIFYSPTEDGTIKEITYGD